MKIPPELQSEMYQMLLRFRVHRTVEGDNWFACPKSPEYLQHADESGRCDCGAEDVQKLLAKIEDCLRTETAFGSLA